MIYDLNLGKMAAKFSSGTSSSVLIIQPVRRAPTFHCCQGFQIATKCQQASPLDIVCHERHYKLRWTGGSLRHTNLFIERGACINAPAAEDSGATVLQRACIHGYLEISRRLSEIGG